MRKILILFLFMILLCSCANNKTDTRNEIVGGQIFESDIYTMEIPFEIYSLIPKRKALKKDNAYYHKLLEGINYDEIYYAQEESLNDKFATIANLLDSFFAQYDPAAISYGTVGCYDRIIYSSFEYCTHEEWDGERGEFNRYAYFYKEELFDKYTYFLFNLKVDFNYVTGYSPTQCGIWSNEIGFGDNMYYPIVQEVIEKENDVYEVEMLYGYDDYEQQDVPFVPCWKSIYSFTVDGERIYINKITVLEKYTDDFDVYYA